MNILVTYICGGWEGKMYFTDTKDFCNWINFYTMLRDNQGEEFMIKSVEPLD